MKTMPKSMPVNRNWERCGGTGYDHLHHQQKLRRQAAGIANVLVQEAAIHIAEQNVDEGEAAYREALAIFEENFGKDNVRRRTSFPCWEISI